MQASLAAGVSLHGDPSGWQCLKLGCCMCDPNPWLLREQLGVGVSLRIVRHGLEWALWGECVSGIPKCFDVSVFSVVQCVGVSQI